MTTITRIKYNDPTIKAFNKREKVAEFDASQFSDADYGILIENLEAGLVRLNWYFGDNGTASVNRDDKIVGEILETDDFTNFMILMASKTPEQKRSPIPMKKAKEPKAAKAKSGDKDESEDDGGVRRMNISKDRRSRKTEEPPVTVALDDFVVDIIQKRGSKAPGRRALDFGKMEMVASENNIMLNGRNNGHKKMNLQNVLEGRYKRGEDVFINGKKVK